MKHRCKRANLSAVNQLLCCSPTNITSRACRCLDVDPLQNIPTLPCVQFASAHSDKTASLCAWKEDCLGVHLFGKQASLQFTCLGPFDVRLSLQIPSVHASHEILHKHTPLHYGPALHIITTLDTPSLLALHHFFTF